MRKDEREENEEKWGGGAAPPAMLVSPAPSKVTTSEDYSSLLSPPYVEVSLRGASDGPQVPSSTLRSTNPFDRNHLSCTYRPYRKELRWALLHPSTRRQPIAARGSRDRLSLTTGASR